MRKEFVDLITQMGMATLKDIRRLPPPSSADDLGEFAIPELEGFDEKKFAQTMSKKVGLTFIDLSRAKVPVSTLKSLKKKLVQQYRAIPIQTSESKVVVATFDPTVLFYRSKLGQELKRPVDYIITTITAWKDLYQYAEDSVEDLLGTIEEVKANATQDSTAEINAEDIGQDVVSFVNKVLAEAFVKGASDIHFEPYEKSFRVRFRIDGGLVEKARPPKSMMLPIVSRLKIMADCDISEKRKPQDGRIKLKIGGKTVDFRVSTLPTLFGEKVVLRILDQSNLQLDMRKLGFGERQLKVFKDGIHRPYGMVLVTGPTGSGKTTTLYSAIADLNDVDSNISTAEDPVEFNLEGINQVNVRKEVGLTFASALKAFLRQDPDIIMVGEIRDQEVGEIAIEAALTGHMVLSTLHTNDAPGTIVRLINFGIDPFLVVAAVNVVVAQRLCRRICTNCKEEATYPVQELIACGFSAESAAKVKTFRGKGCSHCNHTGYKGRVAIYEVLEMNSKLRELILRNGSADEIKELAIESGMKTLRMSALAKVADGDTTIEEALANSASDGVQRAA